VAVRASRFFGSNAAEFADDGAAQESNLPSVGLPRLTGLKTRAVACRERLLGVARHELISRNVLTDDDFALPQIRADVERRGSRVVYARGS
jgi:hypothetical protein